MTPRNGGIDLTLGELQFPGVTERVWGGVVGRSEQRFVGFPVLGGWVYPVNGKGGMYGYENTEKMSETVLTEKGRVEEDTFRSRVEITE